MPFGPKVETISPKEAKENLSSCHFFCPRAWLCIQIITISWYVAVARSDSVYTVRSLIRSSNTVPALCPPIYTGCMSSPALHCKYTRVYFCSSLTMVSMGYLDSQHRYPIRSERGGSALGKKKKKKDKRKQGTSDKNWKWTHTHKKKKKSRFEVRSAKKADKASVFAKRDDGDFVLCVWSSRRFCYMQAHIVKTKGKPFTSTFLLKNLPFLTVRTETITRAHVAGGRQQASCSTAWHGLKRKIVCLRVFEWQIKEEGRDILKCYHILRCLKMVFCQVNVFRRFQKHTGCITEKRVCF